MTTRGLGILVLLCTLNAVASRWQSVHGDQRPTLRKGLIEQHTILDSTYQRPRNIWVYTPPAYDAHRSTPYPLILAFDGQEYLDEIPLPSILDSLIASAKIPEFVAVLIDDSSGSVRLADLANTQRMVEFLGNQLIPYVRHGWHVTNDPGRVIITGSSAGGLGAAFAAFSRPDLFGNVWSQSGAFWRGSEASNSPPWEWLTTQIGTIARKNIRFILDVGAGENHPTLGGSGPNFLEATRRLHRALTEKGYNVTYTEVPGGNHAPQWWRSRLPFGIETLSAGWPRP